MTAEDSHKVFDGRMLDIAVHRSDLWPDLSITIEEAKCNSLSAQKATWLMEQGGVGTRDECDS